MFSFYDSSRYSSFFNDTVGKMDPDDLKAYYDERDRLQHALLDFQEGRTSRSVGYLSNAYQHSILHQEELLRELAFYKALYDQDHQTVDKDSHDLLHVSILLCGFFSPFLILFLPSWLFPCSIAFPIALFVPAFLYSYGIVELLDRRDPDFPFMCKPSHKALLVFFALLPTLILLVYSAIDFLRG